MSLSTVYIIGAGLSGATLARLLAEQGHAVKIYEMRNHIGGNCYDYYNQYGILVQKYGPHIFHTDKKYVYKFLKRFTKFKSHPINVLVEINGILTDLPINFKAIDKFFPQDALTIKQFIKTHWKYQKAIPIFELLNCQQRQTKQWAQFIFKNVYQNYSAKMWGIPISKLDVDVLKRVGVIPSYKHNYFPHDQYQGIPNAGFTEMIKKMLNHKLIKLIQRKPQIKLLKGKIYIDHELISDSIFYCGELDKLLNYRFGKLPYRSLYFKFITYKKESFQSASVINYPNHPKLTRITEYKKINNQIRLGVTTISYEYPGKYIAKSLKFSEPYYPIHNSQNNKKYQKYVKALSTYSNFHLLGRLAEYKYFDMDDVVDNAMKKFKNFVTK